MIWATVAVFGLLAGAWTYMHVAHGYRERKRFREDRERYRSTREREEADDHRERLLERVREQFPDAVPELERLLAKSSDVSVESVLASVPGVRIGVTTDNLPVKIPSATRTRHLCCWGRTGTGKSSLAVRLIADDLNAGRGVVVLGAERELFRDYLLPIVPEERVSQLHYFAPSIPDSTLRWNPFEALDEDKTRAAAELFAVFRRALSEESLGPQSDPIARNTFLALVGMPGATFLSARALLADPEVRKHLVPKIEDRWCRSFFEREYERLPASASRPLLNRLSTFTGTESVRRSLCAPVGNLRIGEIIDSGHIAFLDISGYDPDTTRLLAQMLLAQIQIAAMRRERMPESARRLCHLYADECHELLGPPGSAAATMRQILSKGRRYKIGLAAFSQFPGQLDSETRAEIFGNCATFMSLAVSAQDAATIRRELLLPVDDGSPGPVPAEALIALPIGCAYVRTSTGALAVPVRLDAPLALGDPERGNRVRDRSWERFAPSPSDPMSVAPETVGATQVPGPAPTTAQPTVGGPSVDDRRFLDAVIATPGRNSSEYAKLARMSGASALACRQRLVAAGLIREHQVATGRRGRQALVLEPLAQADPVGSVDGGIA